ncbi:PaaI family thioesterase [Paludibacter sp. 221]|uniref:PaaI family thioesterase n=1 Tax=Paludibacter sp. 221 TaxID=2302939 RepID=UPI0013D8A4CF|nr:PaaI family thioesterase [Paludibacter sp. 221]NDV47418.1 PaaI family thioesterase [Paludibacter sp. 221]
MKKIINPWLNLDGYMCFACSPNNPSGLHMEFYEDGDDIVGLWKPDKHMQSWLNTLHGGIQSTLMDEVGGWVIVRKLQTTGVTSRLDAKFIKNISTNEPQLTVRGRIKEQKRHVVFLETEIYNSQNELCASANIVYFTVSKERALNEFGFEGCKTEGE